MSYAWLLPGQKVKKQEPFKQLFGNIPIPFKQRIVTVQRSLMKFACRGTLIKFQFQLSSRHLQPRIHVANMANMANMSSSYS